jgi:hypothetical protein
MPLPVGTDGVSRLMMRDVHCAMLLDINSASCAPCACWLLCQVTRHVFDEQQGKLVAKADVLEVPVKAGWKPGTKITYAGAWICCTLRPCWT